MNFPSLCDFSRIDGVFVGDWMDSATAFDEGDWPAGASSFPKPTIATQNATIADSPKANEDLLEPLLQTLRKARNKQKRRKADGPTTARVVAHEDWQIAVSRRAMQGAIPS